MMQMLDFNSDNFKPIDEQKIEFEVRSGTRIDSSGFVFSLTLEEWLQRLQQLESASST